MYNIYKYPILTHKMIGGANIHYIPDVLGENIASFLNTEDLRNLRQVSRANRALANQPRVTQKALYNHWMEQVQINGIYLVSVPYPLRNNREIVLAAVRNHGYALQYASQQMQNDREIVLAAVQQNIFALRYASTQLKNNRQFILFLANNDGPYVKFSESFELLPSATLSDEMKQYLRDYLITETM